MANDLTFYKPTKSNWCGNYKVVGDKRVSDLVLVTVSFKAYRIVVSGNDDFMMHNIEDGLESVSRTLYALLEASSLEIEELKELGFEPF